ncbi:hypothetical protein DUP91_28435, partial [Salmonella enterica subsp. enterica]|nr:hypothetical protein [Salmonella enterica subsp. enterica]
MHQGEAVTAELAADTGDTLGESPWWDVRDECLWWVDLRAPALHRLFPATGAITSWPIPGLAGAVVGRQAGGVALALQDGVYAFCSDSHVLRRLAPIQWDQPDMRLNDAKCGPDGVLWFGAMRDFGRDDSGGLYCLRPGGAPRKLRGGVRVPNAIALTPDGHSLYFCDTRAGVIERGTIVGPDVSFQLFSAAAAPGAPDGATLDAEGFL